MKQTAKKCYKQQNSRSKTVGDKAALKYANADCSSVFAARPDSVSSNWKAFLQLSGAREARVRRISGPPPPTSVASSCSDQLHTDRSAAKSCSCRVPAVWFDAVDPQLLSRPHSDGYVSCGAACVKLQQTIANGDADVKQMTESRLSPYVAMDCEMVGVGAGGVDNALARVSLVNALGHTIYDKYVKPREKVTDYRTSVSGILPHHLAKAEKFKVVQTEVSQLLEGRVLVGHAVHNDLRVLLLSHPKRMTRDTANFKPFRKMFNGRIPSLKNLAFKVLSLEIQDGEHDSIEDARAALRLYQTYRSEWETMLRARRHSRPD